MTATDGQGLRADAARNYERIVVAAGQAFEEAGSAVTLEEVARRAGVGVATVYRRFRNREQLVRAVFQHIVTTEIEPAMAVETDDPWHDLVTSLEATVEVLAGRKVVLAIARETRAAGHGEHAPLRPLDGPAAAPRRRRRCSCDRSWWRVTSPPSRSWLWPPSTPAIREAPIASATSPC